MDTVAFNTAILVFFSSALILPFTHMLRYVILELQATTPSLGFFHRSAHALPIASIARPQSAFEGVNRGGLQMRKSNPPGHRWRVWLRPPVAANLDVAQSIPRHSLNLFLTDEYRA